MAASSGSAASIIGALGGASDAGLPNFSTIIGKNLTLRGSYAYTDAELTALAPDLPTVEETLKIKDFDLAAWTGLFGPAGLPAPIVDKLNAALQAILTRPDVREKLLANYIEPTPSDPAAFKAMVRKQLDVWGEKVKVAGIQPE